MFWAQMLMHFMLVVAWQYLTMQYARSADRLIGAEVLDNSQHALSPSIAPHHCIDD
jgi:hypothetical protein